MVQLEEVVCALRFLESAVCDIMGSGNHIPVVKILDGEQITKLVRHQQLGRFVFLDDDEFLGARAVAKNRDADLSKHRNSAGLQGAYVRIDGYKRQAMGHTSAADGVL